MDTLEQDTVEKRDVLEGQPDLLHFRLLAQATPCTKAAQVRQFWPEIKAALAAGHRLKDIRNWLKEAGIEIGYARLCDYVCQLKRLEASKLASDGIPETKHSGLVRNNSLDHQKHSGTRPDPGPTRRLVSAVMGSLILRWTISLTFTVIVFSLGFLIGRAL